MDVERIRCALEVPLWLLSGLGVAIPLLIGVFWVMIGDFSFLHRLTELAFLVRAFILLSIVFVILFILGYLDYEQSDANQNI